MPRNPRKVAPIKAQNRKPSPCAEDRMFLELYCEIDAGSEGLTFEYEAETSERAPAIEATDDAD